MGISRNGKILMPRVAQIVAGQQHGSGLRYVLRGGYRLKMGYNKALAVQPFNTFGNIIFRVIIRMSG